jgi:hypothetical protein
MRENIQFLVFWARLTSLRMANMFSIVELFERTRGGGRGKENDRE